jgi:superoxide reductase
MTAVLHVYKCNVCGNMVEVIHVGNGLLTCCGQAMQLCEENTTDAAHEKHVPVVERTNGEVKVKVGTAAHPMLVSHYIEWIELVAGEKTCRRFLRPDEAPEAIFKTSADRLTVRAYCNLHGLWRS